MKSTTETNEQFCMIEAPLLKKLSGKTITLAGNAWPENESELLSIISHLAKQGSIFRGGEGSTLEALASFLPQSSYELFMTGTRPYGQVSYNLATSIKKHIDGSLANIYTPKNSFDNFEEARQLAFTHFPIYPDDSKRDATQRIRHVYQILGKDLQSPSDVVIYYDGTHAKSLKTLIEDSKSIVLRIAIQYQIPILILNENGISYLSTFVSRRIPKHLDSMDKTKAEKLAHQFENIGTSIIKLKSFVQHPNKLTFDTIHSTYNRLEHDMNICIHNLNKLKDDVMNVSKEVDPTLTYREIPLNYRLDDMRAHSNKIVKNQNFDLENADIDNASYECGYQVAIQEISDYRGNC